MGWGPAISDARGNWSQSKERPRCTNKARNSKKSRDSSLSILILRCVYERCLSNAVSQTLVFAQRQIFLAAIHFKLLHAPWLRSDSLVILVVIAGLNVFELDILPLLTSVDAVEVCIHGLVEAHISKKCCEENGAHEH